MWAAKLAWASRSSGAESAMSTLSHPPADAARRQPDTAPPRRRSRHQPIAYAPATIRRGAATSGRTIQAPGAEDIATDQRSPGAPAPIGWVAP